jgi:hypothetical protein
MNQPSKVVIKDLKERLKYLIDEADYYHRHWKEKEIKIAAYKQTLIEMENMDGNHEFKSYLDPRFEGSQEKAPESSF